MTYVWEAKNKIDEAKINGFSAELNDLHPVLASILIQRGIDTFDKAREYFRPDLGNLHDPFLMKDMDVACKRLQEALLSNEKIRIYGDYDVDGVTSVTMFYEFLKPHHPNLDYYIPDRYSEGYGISFESIDDAEEKGVGLVIALDCGIKAIDKIAYASKKGIDFIVCDHHEAGDELPPAIAVLDPKREDCQYPFKGLCGCGVGFKFLQAFTRINKLNENDLIPLLDLLVVGIAADIVPINGENRILAYFGLKRLNEKPRIGFKSMLRLAKVSHQLTIADVVFKIAPKINAAGRLKSASSAVELLLATNNAEADIAGQYIHDQNNSRKTIDKEVTQHALELIAAQDPQNCKHSTVLYQPDWHKGVVGIVASRVMETYYRPTIILTSSNGKITGSARSVKGFNVYKAIEECSGLIEQFGGHMYAAGLTLKEQNLQAFIDEFEKVVAATIQPEQKHPIIEIDAELPLSQLTAKFYRILLQFAPFGPENMNPVFMSKEVLGTNFTLVGKDHLKFQVFDPNQPSFLIEAIAFGFGHLESELGSGLPFNIAYTVETNHWGGRQTMQLNIKDIIPA